MMQLVCRRPGCTGAVEDGYCGLCGLAAGTSLQAVVVASSRQQKDKAAPKGEAAHGDAALMHSATTRFGKGKAPDESTWPGRQEDLARVQAVRVRLPALPTVDPEAAVLQNPCVPEHKRICSACEALLRREAGFCGKCGARYSFVPTLHAGDIVGQGYEVKGPIAFGGLGWIYLAMDRLLSRYVVLKGLLNSQDASAAAVAVAERQFLASVKHPNIVGIYSFVQTGSEGFIVLEYIGGRTLKEHRSRRGPLPPAEALGYIYRVLPAFAYLHRMGLVFCDFKPENVMLEGAEVKLIDLGGVRRIDDPESDIYGTVGYSAPEAGLGPTPAGDLFTVGRTLAVLLANIPGFADQHRYTLPAKADVPLFAEHESVYRFLLKATAQEPRRRFLSAEEMAEQMAGVLRETLAHEGEPVRAVPSTLFGSDLLSLDAGSEMDPVAADPRYLPLPAVDTTDVGAQAVTSALSLPDPARRMQALRLACRQVPQSREARLRLVSALTDVGEVDEAAKLLHTLEEDGVGDWRVLWFRARLELRQYRPDRAATAFDAVYSELPGELAPKLAMGFAAELAGDLSTAERMYDRVCGVDASYLSAVFGLARTLRARGDRRGAVQALGRISPSSALYLRGRVEAVRALLSGGQGTAPVLTDVLEAAALAETLPLEERKCCFIKKEVYRAALSSATGKKRGFHSGEKLFGHPVTERHVRLGLERAFRELARYAPGDERMELIDEANRVRPRTLT